MKRRYLKYIISMSRFDKKQNDKKYWPINIGKKMH